MSSKWSFLARGDGNRNKGSDGDESNSERKASSIETRDGVDDHSTSAQMNDQSFKKANKNSFSLPIGLSGPNSFKFSPRISCNKDERQRYISFISSFCNETIENGKTNSSGSNSNAQKRLCAMDLGPLWREVEKRDIIDAQDGQDYDSHMNMKLLDPDVVSNQYVMPMINCSLPFHRKHCRLNQLSSTSTTPIGFSENMSGSSVLDDVTNQKLSLEEKLRRERQRIHSNGLTDFVWGRYQGNLSVSQNEMNKSSDPDNGIRIIVPLGGNIYVQDDVGPFSTCPLRIVYEKSMLSDYSRSYGPAVGRDSSAIDPQLSPDGTMIAFVVGGELYVMSCEGGNSSVCDLDSQSHNDSHQQTLPQIRPTRVTYGAEIGDSTFLDIGKRKPESKDTFEQDLNADAEKKRFGCAISHGLADFVAQEEMDRYRGFWWNEESDGILFVRVDESYVPPFRIMHQDTETHPGDSSNYEEHRYPFAGQSNPEIALGYIDIDRDSILNSSSEEYSDKVASEAWSKVKWFKAPDDASEYLARVDWLPNKSVCIQWQNRAQTKLILVRYDIQSGTSIILHEEQSNIWINLHDMFRVLPEVIHPNFNLCDSNPCESILPDGSFSYLFASERTGFSHLYLYTYIAGQSEATLIRAVSSGEWMVESIVGVDTRNDLVYVTGTYDSVLEKHLYMLPFKPSPSSISKTVKEIDHNNIGRQIEQVLSGLKGTRKERKFTGFKYPAPLVPSAAPDPIRVTLEQGMHSVTMDDSCRLVIDTCSDLARPTTTKIYSLPHHFQFHSSAKNILKLHCVIYDATNDFDPESDLKPPEILSFPTSDGSETLYAALYKPNAKDHGEGPYPLICSVYGGPHVQRVTRCWTLSVDVRVQRLCSLGFAVLKCDNRGSSRRGLAFEGAIKGRLGRIEVLDQVTAVRHVVMKQVADPIRVGIYGWSYGGYLAAMCLCRAPDVFRVAISGAPVTSWNCYDTHYTERYMGLPDENRTGYNESAVFSHVNNMKGKLLIIHGLIDENVHFRHSARLITKLISAGKDYDLLLFPNERHSPKKLQDRIYMEKRICDFFIKYLKSTSII